MKNKHREEIYNVIAEVLIQLETRGERLNYSNLYDAVNENIKQHRNQGIARRDFNTEITLSVKDDKFRRAEDKESKWKNKPVYITLTDEGRKQYHQSLMGIPSEPTKYRRKKIFQLLFFYEAAGYGKKFFEADESFDHFLGLLSLTKNDLKPLKKIEDIYGCLYHFRPVNGIKIRRLDENGLPVIYSVTLPGFTLEEILQYHKKSIQEQRSVLAARVERTSVEECEALVYSQQSLGIFSYIQFSEGEIQSAFKELQKAGLIKPISLINGVDPRSAQSINDKRYIIADKRLQNLIDVIWGLYRQKLSLLITKHHINELDKRDREWLIYMFGKEAANKILRGLDVNKRSASDSNIAKMEYQKEQIDFDEQMYFIFKKYKPVLQEYDFQLDLIYKLLYL